MRVVPILLAVVVLAAVAWLLPASVGGGASYVITHGISMEPGFHAGDLAIVHRDEEYRVGDVVAYRSEQMNTVVMHRIIAVDGDRYSFKGDNNNFTDVDHPTTNDFLGRLATRIPEGGTWLQRLGSPAGLAMVAFALLAGGSAAANTRRRRKRRRAAVSRHISTSPSRHQVLEVLPSSLRVSAALGAVLALMGLALGVLAWSGPTEVPSTSPVKSGTRMDFSYSAAVGQTPAYDGTTAHSPDPVFRKLTNIVDVHFTYHGEPGTVTVGADLSTPGGWHSTVPLAGPVTFTADDYEGTVRLDLTTLEAKAQAASAVTGLPAGPLTIALAPQVTSATGTEFDPALKLNLTPLQLALTGAPDTLTVTNTTTTQQATMVARMIAWNGVGIGAVTARVISAVLLLAALAIGVIIVMFARRNVPADEAAAIRRRYAALLVRVHPMPAAQGRPLIDVTTFPTLAKLAERYGLLVLHWNRSGVETFIVQDENITYRYRAGTDQVPAERSTDLIDIEP
ncbi:signal peptidase I [Arthrobacter pascens]|uniref:signal peptidase I n=1 Tax=Arthrobacter pascens TaxID=1677 RepID=UPI0027843718|nr:signal peptidase I [Arthrobacter pascens]MDQ0633171.1 signal peptidase I [Arthrobacter pascens]